MPDVFLPCLNKGDDDDDDDDDGSGSGDSSDSSLPLPSVCALLAQTVSFSHRFCS